MGKRMTKAESNAIGALLLIGLVVGLPAYVVMKFYEAIGWQGFAFFIAASVAGFVLYQVLHKRAESAKAEAHRQNLARKAEADRLEVEARRASLLNKYADQKIVDAIMNRKYWQGQTSERLLDSLGAPGDTDEKVLKTKKREIWKYYQISSNRYGLRITVENDVVVGWDEKL